MKINYITLEFFMIFISLPLFLYFFKGFLSPIPILLLIIGYIYYLYKIKQIHCESLYTLFPMRKKSLKKIFRRFLKVALLLFILLIIYDYKLLLYYVINLPYHWLATLFLYPLLSVLPQEIIFRGFFFTRYKSLFKSELLIVLSSLSFAFSHIVFHNIEAPILALFGGFIFALTYHQKRSLMLVVAEHSLYGLYLYTIGWGAYFNYGDVILF